MATETVPNIVTGTVPYDQASASSGLMFDVLTLIHAAADLNENGGYLADAEGLTDDKNRLTILLILARDKTAAAINTLNV